ncbi:ABC transporter permease [Natrononativus amylolyticus]|uniref:ABC transporter permease n=1 Tax=Natrononativus amylolyticus TaxID=2963434 RepID=UPI0020CF30FA|nr:ABC transporter permease [Natrononativus amylolyticus]
MTLLRLFAKRIALGLVAAWAVLTSVFAMFTLTDDWVLAGQEGLLRFAGADEAELEAAREEYLAARGFDRPLREQYVDWMGDMVLLDWGDSLATGEAVFPLVVGAASRTALYVLPALALGIALGTLGGLYVALNPDSRLAGGGLASAYLLFALPNFWVGGLLFSLTWGEEPAASYSPLVFEHALPILLTTTTLLGGYVSYSRAHSLEYASAEFVTLVKAKGAGRLRVATHVVRNAAIPLFSMLFTEALALLVLAVFVIETLFGIEGFGLLLLEAVHQRDLPVILGSTIVIIGVGVVGNILQDLSYTVLDPRVDTGTR